MTAPNMAVAYTLRPICMTADTLADKTLLRLITVYRTSLWLLELTDINSPGATFSKVPRKILGKLLILGATDTQVATSSRGYSAAVEHCTINRPINSVQRSNRKLCISSSSSNSSSKIRSFPEIFLGTFENAAPDL